MDDVTVYECKDGRTRAYIKDTKRVVSYPKYLMEQRLGRELLLNEQVHHKDEDPLNNNLNNLEIKLLGEHQREHEIKYHDKIITCSWCGNKFLWTAIQQRRFYGNKKRRERATGREYNPFCSRKCAGEYGKHIQLKQ